jgi:hypothetical protein
MATLSTLPAPRTLTLNGRTITVHATRCPFAAGELIFRAWEASSITGDHQTMSSLGLGLGMFGLVGSEMHHATIDAMPFGEERFERFQALRAEAAAFARQAILGAFPELAGSEHGPYMGTEYEIVACIDLA